MYFFLRICLFCKGFVGGLIGLPAARSPWARRLDDKGNPEPQTPPPFLSLIAAIMTNFLFQLLRPHFAS